jgi:hypothetical protein
MARKGDTPEIVAARKVWNDCRAAAMKATYEYQRCRPSDKDAAAALVNEAESAQQAAWEAYSTMLREIGQLPPKGTLIGSAEWY